MKKLFLVLLLVGFVSSCTYSQNMVNPEGQVMRCSSWGWGFIGGPMAISNFNNCIASYQQLGFVEIENVGIPGFFLSEGNPPSILNVQEGFPAARAGMMAGDKILSVNDKKTGSIRDVNVLSFGKPGEMVSYQVQRGEEIKTFVLVKVPKAPKAE